MMRAMNLTKALTRIALWSQLAVWVLCAGAYVQSQTHSICVAPEPRPALVLPEAIPEKKDGTVRETCAPGLCSKGKLSLRIDHQSVRPWPQSECIKITDLDTAAPHRVVIYEDGKPQQSFKFRFSEFQSPELCLFLNDLYWTAQLWEKKDAPWCKCK